MRNLDTLCPNEPQGKETGKAISLYRYFLLPLVNLKQILKMDCPLSATPKRIFCNIHSGGI
jgi:hypothetical protein